MLRKIGCTCAVLSVVILGLIGAGVYYAFRVVSAPKPADPRIGRFVALRPVFVKANGETFSAGTAVAVRTRPGAAPIVLTALHLLGSAGGGYEQETAPADIPKRVRGVLLLPMGGEKPVATARKALRTGGKTLPSDDLDEVNDLAVFALEPRSRVNALPLAAANPGLGEWVWLVGDVVDHQPETQRLFPARVTGKTSAGGLHVVLVPPIELQAFSGAPLINAGGEVVGLLIGGGGAAAVANSAEAIRARLAESGIP